MPHYCQVGGSLCMCSDDGQVWCSTLLPTTMTESIYSSLRSPTKPSEGDGHLWNRLFFFMVASIAVCLVLLLAVYITVSQNRIYINSLRGRHAGYGCTMPGLMVIACCTWMGVKMGCVQRRTHSPPSSVQLDTFGTTPDV